jgi:hypothetical protein
VEPVAGTRYGQGFFADLVNRALEKEGKQSTVVGHNLLGHTTENYAARIFGKGSQTKYSKGTGGLHVFDLLYTPQFIAAETNRLFPPSFPELFPFFYEQVRDAMWRHYVDAVRGENKRSAKKRQYKTKLGQLIAIAPDEARVILEASWPKWIARKPEELEYQGPHEWRKKTPEELIAAARAERAKKKRKKGAAAIDVEPGA